MTSAETLVYKVTTRALWARAKAEGVLPYSPVDVGDGFMHFSTASQLRDTLSLYFSGEDGLVLCAVPVAALGEALKWEPSRGGALFPHLHGVLPLSAVSAHHEIAVAADGTCALPGGIA